MFKGTPNHIDVIVEADAGYDGHLVAMIASKALREAGFGHTERVYIPKGEDERKTLSNTDEYVPSVLDVVREIDPALFAVPVVIAAHDPKPYPMERRLYDRVLLRAETIARALSESDVPSEVWEHLHENGKHRLVERVAAMQ